MLERGADAGFWAGRRVLLTGHTGFKGSWLSLWLQQLGSHVAGYSAGVPTTPSLFELARVGEGMESIAGDVRDLGALTAAVASTAPEIVIHMAAQPLVRRSLAEPLETYETNVMGTVNLLQAVRTAGPQTRAVIVVTSDKCYENDERGTAFSEGDPLGGDDPYSSSKAAAELVVQAFRHSYFSGAHGAGEHPAVVASARAGNVIGGGDWGEDRLLPDIVRAALTGEPLLLRNPDAVRPWQHAINPLSGYLLLAQALCRDREYGRAWNFGPPDGDVRTVAWVAQRVGELWPQTVAWRGDPAAQPPEARYLRLDSSLARERLGWRELLDLDDALRSTVEWHRRMSEGADMRALTLAQIEAACASPEGPGADLGAGLPAPG